MARMDRPETVSEYLQFERVRDGYERNGLCDVCAAQASYGHQHGFRVVLRPCTLCVPVVKTFEYDAPNGWRRASRSRLRRPRMWASLTSPQAESVIARAHLDDVEAAA